MKHEGKKKAKKEGIKGFVEVQCQEG